MVARGWEHLAKEESLRQTGFITLSGTGEDGFRLLWRWVLGAGETPLKETGRERVLAGSNKKISLGTTGH